MAISEETLYTWDMKHLERVALATPSTENADVTGVGSRVEHAYSTLARNKRVVAVSALVGGFSSCTNWLFAC